MLRPAALDDDVAGYHLYSITAGVAPASEHLPTLVPAPSTLASSHLRKGNKECIDRVHHHPLLIGYIVSPLLGGS